MNDEYVEEIHQIRENIYAETKNMDSAELDHYYHAASEQFEKRIAECRAHLATKKQEDEQKIRNSTQ